MIIINGSHRPHATLNRESRSTWLFSETDEAECTCLTRQQAPASAEQTQEGTMNSLRVVVNCELQRNAPVAHLSVQQ